MPKVENDDEATSRLESALYSAGRPLNIEELIRASGTESRTKTLNLVSNLMKKTKSAFKAIEIVTLPDGSYVFQLKPEYSSVEIRGSGVYIHLKELRQLDYIESQSVGRMKIYNTTEKFQKYFGIQGDTETLRQKLFKKIRKTSHTSTPAPQAVTS
jgi:segregation and condensation protein B